MTSESTIGEVMIPEVFPVLGDAPIELCAMHLGTRGARYLPVVDRHGALQGLVEDTAVFHRGAWLPEEGWVPFELDAAPPIASELAVPAGLVVGPSEPLIGVLEALRDGVPCVVIVDPKRHPIGLFTDHDAVALAARTLDPGHLAADAGTRPAATVPREGLAIEVFDALYALEVPHGVIVDGERPVAVLSWRDLVRHDVERRPHLRITAILPEAPLFTLREAESVRTAAEAMADLRIGCVPVVDDAGRLLRILERADVIALLVDQLSRARARLQ